MNSTLLLAGEALMASIALQHAAVWESQGTQESSQRFWAHCGVAAACLLQPPCMRMSCRCCGCCPTCVVSTAKLLWDLLRQHWHACSSSDMALLESPPVSNNWSQADVKVTSTQQ